MPIATEKGGSLLHVSCLPDDADALRLILDDPAGAASIFVDDLLLVHGGTERREPVEGYTDFPVGQYTSFAVTGLQPGCEYIYTVKAVKGGVSSRASEPQIVTTSGHAAIDEVTADLAKPYIRTSAQSLYVKAADGAPIEIYDLAGHIAARSNGSISVTLPRGFYIVRAGSDVVKIRL